jgi:hypothetical protein
MSLPWVCQSVPVSAEDVGGAGDTVDTEGTDSALATGVPAERPKRAAISNHKRETM